MKRYISAILLFAAISVSAQENKKDPLQREVVIEKEFTPIVKDASKINSIPDIEVSSSADHDIRYADWNTPQDTPPVVNTLPAGNNGAEAPNKQRGYARIAIGNYLNLDANAGISIINTSKDKLDVWYDHSSSNAKLSYLQNNKKNTQRRNDNLLHAHYKHNFTKLSWSINADYRYNTFNYYGLPLSYNKTDLKGLTGNLSDQQTVQQYGINTTILSHENEIFNYAVTLAYKGYNSDLGTYYNSRGAIENHFTAHVDANAPLNDYKVGIELSFDNVSYNRIDIQNYSIIGLEPYFVAHKNNVTFRAGAHIDLSINDNTIFRIAPDIRFEWEFAKSCFLYANVDGGKNINSLANMSNITSYIAPDMSLTNTYTPANFTAGFRSTILKKFHFTIFGGIKYSSDALFDYRTQLLDINSISGMLTRNVINFKALNAYAWKAGFDISYKPADFISANLSWEHNEWHRSCSHELIKFYQPRNLWKAAITATPIKQLDIEADFCFADGRGYENEISGILNYTQKGNLPNVVNLNLGAIYRLNKQVHFSAQLNNILSKKYELFYGMPAQRCHFLVGAGISF